MELSDQLDEVSGIGRVTLEELRPYVTVGSGLELKKALYTDPRYWTRDGSSRLLVVTSRMYSRAEGYGRPPEEGGYIGSAVKYYQRMGYQSDHLSVNLTQEKDPGEQLVSPWQLDHRTWHGSSTRR
ncbi:MAG: hypothetical protein U5J63_16450 [Fodinibius sp.]|nr:hypothetical protein [Fodinibius sp.]